MTSGRRTRSNDTLLLRRDEQCWSPWWRGGAPQWQDWVTRLSGGVTVAMGSSNGGDDLLNTVSVWLKFINKNSDFTPKCVFMAFNNDLHSYLHMLKYIFISVINTYKWPLWPFINGHNNLFKDVLYKSVFSVNGHYGHLKWRLRLHKSVLYKSVFSVNGHHGHSKRP